MITQTSVRFGRRGRHTSLVIATLLVLGLAALAFSGSVRADADYLAAGHGLELRFEKAAVSDTVWVGRVDGDVSGVLTTILISADTSAAVWQVEFYWVVTGDDPAHSFVARLSGTLDTDTGAVAMTGHVMEGYREGAAVDEQGQLVDEARSAFEGTIRLQGS
jgi:hypothetical protein